MQDRKISTTSAGPTPSTPGVIVYTQKFDVTGDTEATLEHAKMTFEWSNASVTPRLTGTLHVVNGTSARYRVRLDSYDKNNSLLGSTYDNKKGTPIHVSPKDITVDMSGKAAPNVYYVQVVLEKQGTGDWRTRDSYNVDLLLQTDDVKILGAGIDVGGQNFANRAPTDSATVWWKIGDDGKLTATYTGWLHFLQFDRPGRVVIKAINSLTGAEAARTEGDSHTPADNSHYSFEDTLSVASFATNVEVVMQSFSTDPETGQGVWQDVHSQTVSVAE